MTTHLFTCSLVTCNMSIQWCLLSSVFSPQQSRPDCLAPPLILSAAQAWYQIHILTLYCHWYLICKEVSFIPRIASDLQNKNTSLNAWKKLFSRMVPKNNLLLSGTLPNNFFLLSGTLYFIYFQGEEAKSFLVLTFLKVRLGLQGGVS